MEKFFVYTGNYNKHENSADDDGHENSGDGGSGGHDN